MNPTRHGSGVGDIGGEPTTTGTTTTGTTTTGTKTGSGVYTSGGDGERARAASSAGGVSSSTRLGGGAAMPELGDLRERAGEIIERAAHYVRENPGSSLLIAAGVGYLVGRILRA